MSTHGCVTGHCRKSVKEPVSTHGCVTGHCRKSVKEPVSTHGCVTGHCRKSVKEPVSTHGCVTVHCRKSVNEPLLMLILHLVAATQKFVFEYVERILFLPQHHRLILKHLMLELQMI